MSSDGANGNGVTMRSSGLKRLRRGPGIAELERILREQEAIDITTTNRGNNEEFSFSSSCHPQAPSRLPWPNSSGLQSHVPPTIGSMYGYTNTHSLGRNGGGGSGEHELFPMKLNEVGDGSQSDSENSSSRNLSSESNHAWSYPANIQKRNNGYPPQPMMNHFHGADGTLASPGSLSIGLQNQLEPSSIQNPYYNNTSMSQDGHKMVGIKRSHASSLDNSLIPPSNFQVLPSFSLYNRPLHPSTSECNGVSSYNPTKECYRDAKWGSSLELSNERFNSDKVGPSHANSPPSFTSEVPPPPPLMFPCQVTEDKMENSFQRSESSGNDHQCFFNFLEVKGQERETDAPSGSNHGGLEGGSGGLDLSLKL